MPMQYLCNTWVFLLPFAGKDARLAGEDLGEDAAGREAATVGYILNLELEGCPYCHKSNCPSFYAVDQWGNTCYTPSKCPQYDVHKDPVYYCQTCGKPTGDGSHGTCVQFVTACNCPNCGKWVEAWTCHTH